MRQIDLITVSREFGAGGRQLAEMLGARLGWRVLDRELVRAVAARLGVSDRDVENQDEHAPGLLERIGVTLLRTSPDLVAAPETLALPAPAAIVAAARQVLIDEAGRPPLIVVGHGTQVLFHGRPGALHVRLVASLDSRIRRICQRSRCTDREAAELANQMDSDRSRYVKHYFNRDWNDPHLYHLQLNTALIDLDESTDLILQVIDARSRAAASPRAWAATDPALPIPTDLLSKRRPGEAST